MSSYVTQKNSPTIVVRLSLFVMLGEYDYSARGSSSPKSAAGAAGAICSAACCTCSLIALSLGSVPWFPLLKPTANTLSTTMIAISVQLAFSKKLAVLGAPNTWLALAKLEAKPPPLLFCANTRSVRKMAAATIRIVKKMYIIRRFYYLINL